jgi:hypothetical protein
MTEIEQLRTRIDEFVTQLGHDFPKHMVARSLVVKGCDVSLANVGLMSTSNMMEQAANLLTGRWVPRLVELFIETEN